VRGAVWARHQGRPTLRPVKPHPNWPNPWAAAISSWRRLSAPAVRVALGFSGMHPQPTRNRRPLSVLNRKSPESPEALVFTDEH
jgi:hypothetical protein